MRSESWAGKIDKMLKSYKEIFTPGTVSLQLWSMVARLQVATLPIATIFYIVEESGSFAHAGLVTGALSIATAIFGPLKGRLIDRKGLAWVVPFLMAAHLGALVMMLASKELSLWL